MPAEICWLCYRNSCRSTVATPVYSQTPSTHRDSFRSAHLQSVSFSPLSKAIFSSMVPPSQADTLAARDGLWHPCRPLAAYSISAESGPSARTPKIWSPYKGVYLSHLHSFLGRRRPRCGRSEEPSSEKTTLP